jgi:hypothetical protein|uniref:Uncharacterized protein n=1 Tax=viral metagenome TaxID=1070528 RepID=A0A6C0BIT6_9ZZZZ
MAQEVKKTSPIISGITLFLMQQYPGIAVEQVNNAWKYWKHYTSNISDARVAAARHMKILFTENSLNFIEFSEFETDQKCQFDPKDVTYRFNNPHNPFDGDVLVKYLMYHNGSADSQLNPDPHVLKLVVRWLRVDTDERLEWEMKAQLMIQAHLFG